MPNKNSIIANGNIIKANRIQSSRLGKNLINSRNILYIASDLRNKTE